VDRVKLIISGNPEDVTHPFGQLAEPKTSWAQFNLEADYQWESKRGYNVLRLDGAQSENVIQQKEVYPGIISYQGFLDHLSKGDTHPEYICFARGAFALKGTVNTLINRQLIDRNLGDALYHEGSTRIGAVDIALRNDKVMMAYGRYGMATGWRDNYASEQLFSVGTSDAKKSRFIMQVEGFYEFTGFDGDAVTLCKQIIAACHELNIKPRNLAVDQTGLGEGVYSYLKNYMGDIYGINWTDAATEYRIMKEDAELPHAKYYKIGDEMWFCFQQWLNFGALLISPKVPSTPFFDQLTNRRIARDIGGKRKMETKDEYKARNRGMSPDEADSALMLPMLVRARGGIIPSMTKGDAAMLNAVDKKKRMPNIESIDSLRFNSLQHQKAAPKPFDLSKLTQPMRNV